MTLLHVFFFFFYLWVQVFGPFPLNTPLALRITSRDECSSSSGIGSMSQGKWSSALKCSGTAVGLKEGVRLSTVRRLRIVCCNVGSVPCSWGFWSRSRYDQEWIYFSQQWQKMCNWCGRRSCSGKWYSHWSIYYQIYILAFISGFLA